MVVQLTETNTLISQYISEIRDINIQNDRLRFRKNLERLGSIFAYEISKTLEYENVSVETPLGVADSYRVKDKVVIAAILRAGLPVHQGVLDFFDFADNAFISAYRKHHKDGSFEIDLQYITCPNLSDKVLVISDPMLATGASLGKALEAIQSYGSPKEIHIITIIACKVGVEYISRLYPDVTLWVGAMDDELTAKSYIVPGLGDAGDLSYGSKVQE